MNNPELVDSFVAHPEPKEHPNVKLPIVGIKWYSDGSVRIRLEGMGPVVVDELYINQKEPLVRLRPASVLIEAEDD